MSCGGAFGESPLPGNSPDFEFEIALAGMLEGASGGLGLAARLAKVVGIHRHEPFITPSRTMPNGWNVPLALMVCLWAWIWGVAPGWYEPGLWPKIYAVPQSLRLVGIS